MRRFKQILFVAHGVPVEEAALRRAVALAENSGARLTVTRVVAPPPRLPVYGGGLTPNKLFSLISEEAQEDLARSTAALPSHEVPIETEVLVGTAFV